MLTEIQLRAMKNCAPLLPEPSDEVVIQLITEIERLQSEIQNMQIKLNKMTDSSYSVR